MPFTSYFRLSVGHQVQSVIPFRPIGARSCGAGCWGEWCHSPICSLQNVPCSSTHISLFPCPTLSWVPFALISDCLCPLQAGHLLAIELVPHLVGPDSAYVLITGCWRPQSALMGPRNLSRMGWSSWLILENREERVTSTYYVPGTGLGGFTCGCYLIPHLRCKQEEKSGSLRV